MRDKTIAKVLLALYFIALTALVIINLVKDGVTCG
jgi:hypothetical protein